MKKQSIWVFQWRKSVHYWWSYILFSPECKELTSMLDPLLYRWGVPPVVIRCVHWTMQMWVLQTWIKALGLYIVMKWVCIMYLQCKPLVNLKEMCPVAVSRLWGGGEDGRWRGSLVTYATVPVSVWLPEPARDRGRKQKTFKRRFLPHHKSQRCDIWCTGRPVVSCFNPNFVDRYMPHEAKEGRVKFRRSFGNRPSEFR